MELPLPLKVKLPSGQCLVLSVSINDSVLGVRQLLSELPISCKFTHYELVLIYSSSNGVAEQSLNEYEDLVSYAGIAQAGARVEMRVDLYNAQTARFQVRRLRELLSAPPIDSPAATLLLTKKQQKQQKKTQQKKKKQPTPTPTPAAAKSPANSAAKVPANPAAKAAVSAVVVAATAAASASSMATAAAAIVSKAKGIVPTLADTAPMPTSTPAEMKEATQQYATIPIAPDAKLSSVFPLLSPFRAEGAGAATAASPSPSERFPCVQSVTFSGWNPPPKPRALMGDLFYLEVVTMEHQTLHLTACPDGFYVNQTRASRFDPRPAKVAHNSQTLLDLLCSVSSQFTKQWGSLLEQTASAAAALTEGSDMVDPTFAFLATPWQTGLAAMASSENVRACWCVEKPPTLTGAAARVAGASSGHTYDRNRAESDLTNETMGVSIGLGMACETQPSAGLVRDWNEELQCCREMPRNTVQASIARSRALCKVLADFEIVAGECAVAVALGHVPPINPLDAPDAHVFVHNNVFFSLAVDGRGTYQNCGGDAAAFSAASHDLRGVMELARAEVDGLHTLATAVIDFMGKRIIAQSIIPGILHGEAASSLVYGSVDHGSTVYWNEHMHELMSKVAKSLHIAESVIAVPEFDEEAEAAELAALKELEAQGMSRHQLESQSERGSTKWRAAAGPLSVFGPVEGKGIVGSDGRYYVLDIIRTTPRDLNYCAAASSIGGGRSIPGVDAEAIVAAGEADAKKSLADAPAAETDAAAAAAAAAAVETAAGAANPVNDEYYTAVLRPELVQHYVQYRANRAKMLVAANTAQARREELLKQQQAAAATTAASASATATATATAADGSDGASAEAATVPADDFVVVNDPNAVGVGESAPASVVAAVSSEAASPSAEVAAKSAPAATAGAAAETAVPVRLNTNVFTLYKHGGTEAERDADRSLVMDAAHFLKRIMIPTLLRDIRLQKAFCVDGESLCESMHLRGVNLRYLGTLAQLAAESEGTRSEAPLTPFALEICEVEMVARCYRKMLWSMLGENKELLLAPAITVAAMMGRLLSCEGHVADTTKAPALSPQQSRSKRKGGRRGEEAAQVEAASSPSVVRTRSALAKLLPTREAMWSDLRSRVEAKYGYELKLWPGFPAAGLARSAEASGSLWAVRANRLVLLRRVCQLCGVVVEARDYSWGAAEPISPQNIADLRPVVKSCSPKVPCTRARDMLERGRMHLSAGRLQIAGHLVQEALALLYQVHQRANIICGGGRRLLCVLARFSFF